MGGFMIFGGSVIILPIFLLIRTFIGHMNHILGGIIALVICVASLLGAGFVYPYFYNDDETAKRWWYRWN